MFISVSLLRDEMGVDESLARFFVDRKVPANNAFWSKRYVYVGRANGFVNIPVYYDLLHRIGVPKSVLLAEEHLRFMEQLMHYAMLQETGEISFFQQLEKMNELLAGRIRDPGFYHELITYLTQPELKPLGRLGLPVAALNRADVFLFILCDLPLSPDQLSQAITYWYALHPTYLIYDDVGDYAKDKAEGEENALLALGGGEQGFEKAMEILEGNAKTLMDINPQLAEFMFRYMEDIRDWSLRFD